MLALSAAVAGGAAAQDPAPAPADPNVTPYAPDYFAEFRPVTALDMIGRIPGFQFDGGSSARGFAGTAGNVLIDGVRPPTRGDSLASVLSRIPAAQVLRIDVVRAGAGGIDMQGKAVVANVIRKPDAGVSGSAAASLSMNDQGRFQPGVNLQARRQRDGRSMDGSFRFSTGSQEFSGVRERRRPNGEVLLVGLNDGDVGYSNGETTGVYEGPLGGGRVRANVLVNYSASLFEGTDILIFPGGQDFSRSDSTRWRGEAGLRWNRSLPRGMNLELVGFQSLTQNDNAGAYDTPFFTTRTLSDQTSGESIVSGTLKFAPLETGRGALNLEAGSETALNWVDSATAYTFDGSPLFLPGDDTRVEELRNESFVTALWAARPNLSVEANLRYELSRITADGSAGEAETTLGYLKPRLAATWTVAPRNTLTFKLEKSVDQLSFGAFTASAAFATDIYGRGNPDIRPAQIWLSSARYERLFGTQGSFVAEFTHEVFEDVLGVVVIYEIPPGGTTPRPFNITRNVGGATRDRLTLSGRLPLDRWGMSGGLLSGQVYHRWSDTTDPVTFVDRRLSGEQATGWSIALNQNLVAQRINWNVSMSSGQDTIGYSPSVLSRFSSQPTGQFNLTYRPDPQWSVTGGLYVGSGSRNEFTLYNAPRHVGTPVYTEASRQPGTSQVSLNVRRSF
ncbi:TonB-dependent receptor [Brevundimonas basaltis]